MNAQNQSSDVASKASKMIETIKALRGMSKAVKPLVKSSQFTSINEALISTYYKNSGHEVFKTFEEWKREGKHVIKGSHAFTIWGMPIEKGTVDANGRKELFWPVSYIFSNLQVQ